ncbi:hypothetical protein D3C85_422640 [compost metagenome]
MFVEIGNLFWFLLKINSNRFCKISRRMEHFFNPTKMMFAGVLKIVVSANINLKLFLLKNLIAIDYFRPPLRISHSQK